MNKLAAIFVPIVLATGCVTTGKATEDSIVVTGDMLSAMEKAKQHCAKYNRVAVLKEVKIGQHSSTRYYFSCLEPLDPQF